jgi:hypothetical protein
MSLTKCQPDVPYPEIVQSRQFINALSSLQTGYTNEYLVLACDQYLRQMKIEPSNDRRITTHAAAFSNLPIRRDCHKNDNHPNNFTFKRYENIVAMKIQLTGDLAPKKCMNCARGGGLWKECVITTLPTIQVSTKGACANCYYNGSGRRCSLRRPNNHRRATRDPSLSPDAVPDAFLDASRRQVLWEQIQELDKTCRALDEATKRYRQVLRTTRLLAEKSDLTSEDFRLWADGINDLLSFRSRVVKEGVRDDIPTAEARLSILFTTTIYRLESEQIDLRGLFQLVQHYRVSCEPTGDKHTVPSLPSPAPKSMAHSAISAHIIAEPGMFRGAQGEEGGCTRPISGSNECEEGHCVDVARMTSETAGAGSANDVEGLPCAEH